MVISSINVDLTRLTPAPIAYAKQGDANTRYIAVSLFDDGEPYTIPAGMAAAFRLAKPDGTFCFYDNENGEAAVTTSGNVATILLAEQALTAAGTGYAEVNLYDANGKLIDSHYEATSDYKARNKVILVAPGELPNQPAPSAPVVTPIPLPENPAPVDPVPADPTPAEPVEPTPAEPAPEVPESGSEETDVPIIVVPDLTEIPVGSE